jgi:hypothetical protein
MLTLAKWVLIEYKILVMKTGDDLVVNIVAKNNYELLCDYNIILDLIFVCPC